MRILLFRLGVLGGAGVAGLAAAEPGRPTAPPVDSAALFEVGRQLFEQLPDEVKSQYAFPSQAEWDAKFARVQRALAGDSLPELAALAPEARQGLALLRLLPDYSDLADWLEQRLDEIEAAQTITAPRPPPVPAPPTRPETPRPPAVFQPVPHYQTWLERVRGRPVPPRAAALLPVLRAAFAAEGVPEELVWLAEAESSFNPAARSPVGAKGLFQFMPDTAKAMGLATFLPDERTDPAKSARAAARYLRTLHGRFGNWALALAAYNAGEGRVGRTLAAQKAQSFTAIAEALPAETRMYVPKVCALIAARAGVAPERIPPPRQK